MLLAWVETPEDLAAIHTAAKVTTASHQDPECCVAGHTQYSITVSQEYASQFWKAELTQVVYELYPDIMEGLKTLNRKVDSFRMVTNNLK